MFLYLYGSKCILKENKKNIKYLKEIIKLNIKSIKFRRIFTKERLTYDFLYDFFMLFDYILENDDRIEYTTDTGEIIEIIIYRQNRDRILSRYDSLTIRVHDGKHVIERIKMEFTKLKTISYEWYRCKDKKRYVLEPFRTKNTKDCIELENTIKKYFIMIFDIIMKGV